MTILKLAFHSALSRIMSLSLAILSVALSVTLIIGIDKIRKEVKGNFLNTISETDLIAGPRTGAANLLLYTVFHLGDSTSLVEWDTFKEISAWPEIKWAVPLSIGDSHSGFRVTGTNRDFFQYFKYGNKQSLQFQHGNPFKKTYEAVIGADAASQLGYHIKDQIVLSHGVSHSHLTDHDDKPFIISGILKKTGTPVDQTILVSLEGVEAIHADWRSGMRMPFHISAERAEKLHLEPGHINSFLIGLHTKSETLQIERKINNFKKEPLMAILPGVTLNNLWQKIRIFEQVLLFISGFVLLAAIFSILTTLLATLNERRREMAVLRAIGAHTYDIILLFMTETLVIITGGALLGIALMYLLLWIGAPVIMIKYGFTIHPTIIDSRQLLYLGSALLLGVIFSLIPGLIAYRQSLSDGLTIRN